MAARSSSEGSLQLLVMPFSFTQDALWDTGRFLSAARRCGYRLTLDDLAALDEAGLLVPLYRVADDPRPELRLEITPNGNLDSRRQAQYAAVDGRLRDGAAEPYSADWPYRPPGNQRQNRHWWNGFLYASWQLLDVHQALSFGKAIEADLMELPAEQLARQRQRILALAVLAPQYLPGVIGRLRVPPTLDEAALRRFRFESDVQDLLARVGYPEANLQQDAIDLLQDADGRDPLRGWLPLVRHARYSAWQKLRDGARDCLWLRIGAEVLLRANEDLSDRGLSPALPDVTASSFHHALHDRLGRRAAIAEPLEETLGRFGLSPHPKVLLLVEGETELDHFPKLLDAFGLSRLELVRVQNAHGSGQNPQLLARYAVTPRIRQQAVDGGWQLVATPTALVIAMDPENRWATPDMQVKERRKLQLAIRDEVKLQGGDIGQDELDTLVSIHVWGSDTYEFAHFTDDELLSALAGLAHGPDDADRGSPAWQARKLRELQQARTKPKNLNVMIGRMRVSKPELAVGLWPALLAKCEHELETDVITIPALKVVLEVERLVGLLSGGGYAISAP